MRRLPTLPPLLSLLRRGGLNVETSPPNVSLLSAADRQVEIARILSRAFMQLRRRGCAGTDDTPVKHEDSSATSLEVVPEKGLTVPAG